jgi:hypothetical protein
MGVENRKGWLGEPFGEIIHLAKGQENLLGSYSDAEMLAMIRPAEGTGVEISMDKGVIRLEGADPSQDLEVVLEDMPCSGSDLTVFLTCSAESRTIGSPEPARALFMLPDIADPSIKDRNYYSYANEQVFESVFYYSIITGESTDLTLTFEGGEPVYLHSIEAYAQPDVLAREFEHGVVLANPSDDIYAIDLPGIFGHHNFHRIRGHENQDPVTNNGAATGETLELPGKDALFLVKETKQ